MADGSHHSGFLDFGKELVVDLFAGGGGASLGIARAYREPDIAINHNPVAVAVHRANHPHTKHFISDVFEVDPLEATGGRPVGVLWASPDCRHHSKAKGGKPRSKRVRGLAWVVVKWASVVKPRLIHLENVEEFADWGPLDASGQPDRARKGATFRKWVRELERLGYQVDWRERIAANSGTPTIRKRLYIIARCDGRPIVWPQGEYAKVPTGKLKPWRTAAEHCIDWTIPGKTIFGRKKPLAKNTRRRIARGLWKFTINTPTPFLVPLRGTSPSHHSVHAVDAPLSTVSGQGTHHALVATHLTEFANASSQRSFSAEEPLRTQCAQVKGGHFAMVGAHVTKFRANSTGSAIEGPLHTVTAGGDMARPAGAAHAMGLVAGSLVQIGWGERAGQAPRALDPGAPLGTVVAGGVKQAAVSAHLTHLTHHGDRSGYAATDAFRTVTGANRGEQALVSVFLEQANGGFYDGAGRDCRDPLSTITTSGAQQRLVTACLVKYYSCGGQWQGAEEPMHTVPTKDRIGVVQTIQMPGDALSPEQLEGARRVAAFLHEELPEHFPEPFDVLLMGDYVMTDITLRMLVPRELARAQGFPDDYYLEWGLFEAEPGSGRWIWLPISKTDQVKLIGNSVCPQEAEILIAANAADLIDLYSRQEAA